jgi:NADH dehydrogenase [ubiquinone] 1 alpha subcomplex assembly factor 7
MHRLTDADQMGDLFKVMGLAAPNWPDGVGF